MNYNHKSHLEKQAVLGLENENFCTHRKVTSASLSRFEAHVGLFRLLMKGIFDPYVL